jgi:hypothetical protein
MNHVFISCYFCCCSSLQAILVDASLRNNTSWKGAGVYAMNDATIMLQGRAVVQGNAAEVDGGGMYFYDSSVLEVSSSARITHSFAGSYAGGLYFVTQNFDPAAVVPPVVADNIAKFDHNVGALQRSVTIVGPNVVHDFVITLGSTDGLLPVVVNVSGWYGFPNEGMIVQATLEDGQFLGVNQSNAQGMVQLLLKVSCALGRACNVTLLYTVHAWHALTVKNLYQKRCHCQAAWHQRASATTNMQTISGYHHTHHASCVHMQVTSTNVTALIPMCR